jgi:formylglycine-generating enzyme required for sulfatase activity
MPKKDRPEAHSDTDDVSVHLKPILGVRPGVYLTALYGVIAVLLIFFLFFYPGLRNRGSYLSLATLPEHATVKVDGAYAGSTPCVVFLRHGQRNVEISKPFYNTVTIQEKVGGRVFGTLFIPDGHRKSQLLTVADVEGLLSWAREDFQRNPGIPSVLSDAAYAANTASPPEQWYDFINDSMLFVTNEFQLKELLQATARVASKGSILTPASFVTAIQHSIQLKQKYDNFPSWLLLVLSRAHSTSLAASPWVQQYLASYREAISRYYQPASLSPGLGSGGRAAVQGMEFRSVPAGDLVMGKDDNLDVFGKSIDLLLAHPVHVDSFYLGSTEVTKGQYQSFIQQNPEWAPANRPALVQKGLVTDAYLSDWTSTGVSAGREGFPVTSVSWHAAVAFTAWLSRSVQAALPGYVAQLPSEAQWEWAARGGLRGMPYPLGGKPGAAVFFQKGITGPSRAGASEPNGYGLRDMLGNVWEWCADPFALTTNLLSSLDPRANMAIERALPRGPDYAVRGGAWENPSGVIKVYSRGSQPSAWCTPYLGFRVALTRQ